MGPLWMDSGQGHIGRGRSAGECGYRVQHVSKVYTGLLLEETLKKGLTGENVPAECGQDMLLAS